LSTNALSLRTPSPWRLHPSGSTMAVGINNRPPLLSRIHHRFRGQQ
jgi:hypothetical protein